MLAPISVGQNVGKHHVDLPQQLILRVRMRGSIGLTTMLQPHKTQSQIPSQAYANYAMGPLQVSFLFQSRAFNQFILSCVGICYGVCFLLTDSLLAAGFTNGGSTIWACNTKTLQSISRPMYLPDMVHGTHQECNEWLLLPLL